MRCRNPAHESRSLRRVHGRLKGEHHLDVTVRLLPLAQLLLESVKGWSKDNVPRLGASLAYYTLFSIAPVLIIVIAVAGYFFGADAVRGEIVRQVDGLIGVELSLIHI